MKMLEFAIIASSLVAFFYGRAWFKDRREAKRKRHQWWQ